jgi:uncharacterized protein
MHTDPTDLQLRLERLRRILADMGSALIGFSGGVDSGLLLRIARDVLADRVLAVTASSPTTPARELRRALDVARDMGAAHVVVAAREMHMPEFTANSPDRCYLCKKVRFADLLGMARQRDLAWVADGSNMDDRDDFRPGARALRELGVRSPLCEAELSKGDIRALAKEMGLSIWNLPSNACLASRIPYGTVISAERLRRIDLAEDFLRDLGVAQQVRVRHVRENARIEVPLEAIGLLTAKDVRSAVVERFRHLGFTSITLDLEGYRSGSLHRAFTGDRPTHG